MFYENSLIHILGKIDYIIKKKVLTKYWMYRFQYFYQYFFLFLRVFIRNTYKKMLKFLL